MISIITAGPFSTIQDSGRYGYQHLGVPTSGVLDSDALIIGNHLLGNHLLGEQSEMAAIEICFGGFQARTTKDIALCLTGSCDAIIRHHHHEGHIKEHHAGAVVTLPAGAVFEIPPFGDSLSALLCVSGGVDVPYLYGSRSTTTNAAIGGYEGRILQAGDNLSLGPSSLAHISSCTKEAYQYLMAKRYHLRLIFGPQDFWFSPESAQRLCTNSYQVSPQTSRMGMRLIGPALSHKEAHDIISDGMVRGVLQVPADGQPIIAMADHGTMGGYAKIACIISADLPALGRLRPHDEISFSAVTEQEAAKAWRDHKALLAQVTS